MWDLRKGKKVYDIFGAQVISLSVIVWIDVELKGKDFYEMEG